MSHREADRIIGIACPRRREHKKAEFITGIKAGIHFSEKAMPQFDTNTVTYWGNNAIPLQASRKKQQ